MVEQSGSKGNVPRRPTMRFPDARLHEAIRALVQRYAKHSDFMDAFEGFVTLHHETITMLAALPYWPKGPRPPHRRASYRSWFNGIFNDRYWRRWSGLPVSPETTASMRNEDGVIEQTRSLVNEAIKFALDWGLRADWAAGLVVNSALYSVQLDQTYFGSVETAGAWSGRRSVDTGSLSQVLGVDLPTELNVDATAILIVDHYDPTLETWDAFQKRILVDLRSQRDEIEQDMEETGWKKSSGKSSLDDHVAWLFLAIFPDPELGRPLYFLEIADVLSDQSEHIPDENSITRAISGTGGLAAQLGIELPHSQGRPPGSHNIRH